MAVCRVCSSSSSSNFWDNSKLTAHLGCVLNAKVVQDRWVWRSVELSWSRLVFVVNAKFVQDWWVWRSVELWWSRLVFVLNAKFVQDRWVWWSMELWWSRLVFVLNAKVVQDRWMWWFLELWWSRFVFGWWWPLKCGFWKVDDGRLMSMSLDTACVTTDSFKT